ncbi:hypothetical protein SLS62_007051 [Diatrype stigma]|uniref:Uncharacterized protein n=1 Tax=Diatrype stigma TaxID=117547 RepID=A0AAN9UMG3_9PEZI
MYQAWDTLKVQVNHFNQVVAIPMAQFRAWSAEEKATIQSLMMTTVNKSNAAFALDTDLPDRVYLAASDDFEKKGIFLIANFADRGLPLMTRQQAQLAPQAAQPAPGTMTNKVKKPAPAGARD